MKVGYLQYDVSHDLHENLRCISSWLQKFDGDLLVLPELSLCGYLFPDRRTLEAAAEAVPAGESVRTMAQLSKQHNCILVFGLAELDGGRVYNTAVVVDHGRYAGKYRKIHLSDFEKTLFIPGSRNEVIETGAGKLGVQICFDLWFPEVSREQIRQGAELLCVLANFGGESTYLMTQTRAMENLTPLILCNRIGSEHQPGMDADFLGKSTVLDAAGVRCSAAEAGKETMQTAELVCGHRRGNIICRDFEAEIRRHPFVT